VKKSFFQNHQMIGLLCGAAALAVAALAPQSASAAGTAANAKILNVVTVNYYDATGKNGFQAATSTSVLVTLKQAPLTVATKIAFTPVDSGVATTSYVALTSNANGSDGYKLTFGDTPSNLSANPITTNIVSDLTGGTSTGISTGGTVNLGATSIVSVAAASGGSQVISIPGGALNGIGAGSIVVIGTTSYKVTAATPGQVASYSNTGVQTSVGSLTPEVLGTITIAADPNDSNATPNLSGSLAGTIIGERKYLQITDTGTVSSNTANGTDSFSVSTDTTSGGNAAALASNDVATFYFVSLSINKTVSNVTNPGAGANGKPGDVLEYTVTVINTTTGGNAGKVSIADSVPAYTTLVSGGTSLGTTLGSGAATDKFATISDGTGSVDITLDPTDSEPQPSTTVGYGGTAGHGTAAGTAINFYLGTGSGAAAGGTVAATKAYTIKYRVMIN